MNLHQKIALQDLGILNPLITDYINLDKKTAQLYSYAPEINNVEQVLQAKKNFKNRTILHTAFTNQFKGFNISDVAQKNLSSITDENTFTVCTAHQLCLFTGPSYFVYKIMSAIKLCNILKEKHPTKNFVPVYWMGSEDHDFDEINHAIVYGKKITWKNEDAGAVGMHSLNGMQEAITELSEILGNQEKAQKFINELTEVFTNKENYGKAFQEWIMHLFADYGLLVLDQNDKDLKQTYKASMQAELLNNTAEKALAKNEAYLTEHYHVQASSRPINLFYLADNLRERIEKEGNQYKVLNTDITFSETEILEELEQYPEKFSPNVILRPTYQETVLPNVAFVGGPGEVAYWLQLKDVFKALNVEQPLILLRDMAVVMQKNHLSKLKDWSFTITDLFTNYDQLAKEIVENESKNELQLAEEKESIEKLFSQIKDKAVVIDKNLERSVDSELQKVINSFNNLESKLIRAEKKNFEQKLSQLENIQSKLLPNNTLQERYDNFIPVYLRNSEDYYAKLLENFNAFETELKVFEI